MAKRQPREKLPEEIKLNAFDEKIGDKEMTEAQKQERAKLHEAVKVAKFRKNASKHGSTVLSAIEKLGACANTKRYSYTPAQVEQLKGAIADALKGCFSAFEGKMATKARFSL